MDDVDGTGAVVHDEGSDTASTPDPDVRPLTQPQSVELEAWEWRLLRCALQHASTALGEQDVDARLVGDRLYGLDQRISTQLVDDDQP